MTKTTDEPIITVRSLYRRTVQPAQYETAVAEVEVSESFFGSVSPEDIANQSMSQFEIIKSEVLQQLGRPFEQDEATGRIMEIFPGSTVVESKAPPARRAVSSSPRKLQEPEPDYEDYPEGGYPEEEPEEEPEPAPVRRAPRAPRPTTPTKPAARTRQRQNDDEDPDGHWQDLMENPSQWWDNRDSKPSPKSPDFTHKTKKEGNFKLGLWLRNAPSWFKPPYD